MIEVMITIGFLSHFLITRVKLFLLFGEKGIAPYLIVFRGYS